MLQPFDLLVLLTSIPPETSILLKYSIYNLYKQPRKPECNICCFHGKQP